MNFQFIEYCDFQKKSRFVLLPAVQAGPSLCVEAVLSLRWILGLSSAPRLCGCSTAPSRALALHGSSTSPALSREPFCTENPFGSRFSSFKEEGGERFSERCCQLTEGGY